MYELIKMNVAYQRIRGVISVFNLSGISSTTIKYSDKELKILYQTRDEILPPRVKADYDAWMGKNDEFHRLFYLLSFSKHKKHVYRLVVFFLKIFTLNSGFIKNFRLKVAL